MSDDPVGMIDGAIRDWGISPDAMRWVGESEREFASPSCDNCERPIRPLSGSSTGWTHGVARGDWRGVRCPGRVTGAWPGDRP